MNHHARSRQALLRLATSTQTRKSQSKDLHYTQNLPLVSMAPRDSCDQGMLIHSFIHLTSYSQLPSYRMCLVESSASNSVIAMLEVPGMKKANILITAHGGRLIIAGNRVPQAHIADGYSHTFVDELKYGKFIRVIMLPPGLEVSIHRFHFRWAVADFSNRLGRYQRLWRMVC